MLVNPADITTDRTDHANTTVWVADVLRRRIAAGELAPGTKLSEQQLAASMQVSRNTLREAFTMLSIESVVTRFPNRGVFVAAPDADAVREIYRVRRMLEPAAVLWGPELDLNRLDAVVAEARDAKRRGAVPDMAAANQAFHEALIAMSGSLQLQQMMGRVLAEMRLVFHAMSAEPEFHTRYVEENAALVDLLRAGRRAEAADTLRGYLDAAEAELLGHLGA
ncbi:GntR family transcriptional regulator [Arthrobacter sp. zg-Y820]|uniref:GntR family transcriptional regulator n=1 Tax=unclassified Arthrobacter TaxID=235627 RepID=UPI001E2C47C4|nr:MULTISPECIES: GntR family transcriptional regulator [unclassified Arthrobacter]MCC9195271.1 GntR family transcriptional regulator [Arthrobacter sp. zg-Y820]MDK1278130.1 GntR family transcriptional regulator [Arthrobacter sp. zg.Y820]WIB10019.1 GntR family transcriptional regulator [Arthrobacter sp. zg-Y820]